MHEVHDVLPRYCIFQRRRDAAVVEQGSATKCQVFGGPTSAQPSWAGVDLQMPFGSFDDLRQGEPIHFWGFGAPCLVGPNDIK